MQSRTTVVTTTLECGNNSDCDYYHIIMVFHWAYCTPQTRDNSVKYSNRFFRKNQTVSKTSNNTDKQQSRRVQVESKNEFYLKFLIPTATYF